MHDIQVSTAHAAAVETAADVLAVAVLRKEGGGITVSEEVRELDRVLEGQLSELLEATHRGAPGEIVMIPTLGRLPATQLAVVGVGSGDDIGAFRKAAANLARRVPPGTELATFLHRASNDPAAAAGAVVEGALLGAYRYDGVKNEKDPARLVRLTVHGTETDVVARAEARARATWLARDLTNEPATTLTPLALAARAEEIAEIAGLECEVWHKDELEERGFGGILGVAKGSHDQPALVCIRRKVDGASKRVALVGKGVTYDTGGYSIKPSAAMEMMKTDMGGAAAVLGAMSAAGRAAPDVDITAYIPTSDNVISATAIRPGDVLTMYGGTTVEVTNTDAEGRLLLADAIVLAAEDQPDLIVNVATLTGHAKIALGLQVGALFSNDDELKDRLMSASEAAGEPVWPLPLFKGYRADLSSQVADLKNSGPRYGGAITAALFLQHFVPDGIPWAHLDIAGPGRSESDKNEISRGGTGATTRLLLSFLEDLG